MSGSGPKQRRKARGVYGAERGRAAARSVVTGLALGAAVASGLAAPGGAVAAEPGVKLGECAAGELCLWPKPRFAGGRHTYELSDVRMGTCERLPRGADAESFANRTGRPVTVYESGECAETREFHTHPSGSWTPEGAYGVRAFKVWER